MAKEKETKAKIKISNLHKAFGKKTVLDGLDLEIKQGESLVVIGGSGTGKSVLIKCIQGILTPEEGSILVDDKEVVGVDQKAKEKLHSKMGMLFQGGALFDSLLVWENVAFGLMENHKMPRKEAKTIAIQILRQVGLAPAVADLSPSELSGGMQKRVSLARAIATKPEIIFFDEPTTGLDPIMADVINDLIIESVKGLGATALTITHDMASARKIADRIAMLYKGKIVWQGSVKELDKTKNEYVRQFIEGSSQGPIQVEF
jgi:phospholipid/cholesterol/gamma-HCH transport system ATP-binding protein